MRTKCIPDVTFTEEFLTLRSLFTSHKPEGGREREGKVGKRKEMKKIWKEGKKSKNTANVWKNLALEQWR